VALRTAGATLQECADQALRKFGKDNLPKHYDSRSVWRDIKRALDYAYRDIREDFTAFRLIQMDRYESIIRALWPKAITQGRLGATDRILKAMKDQNRLLGLDAPQEYDVRVLQIDARIEQLMESMAARREAEIARSLGDGRQAHDDSVVEGTARHL